MTVHNISSLTAYAAQLERSIKVVLRSVPEKDISQVEKKSIQKILLACHEARLDIRDYEYAQTRAEQLKWAKIARHNLHALEVYVLGVGIFGPADVAELSAMIGLVKDRLV